MSDIFNTPAEQKFIDSYEYKKRNVFAAKIYLMQNSTFPAFSKGQK
jgi:hypothetical protein